MTARNRATRIRVHEKTWTARKRVYENSCTRKRVARKHVTTFRTPGVLMPSLRYFTHSEISCGTSVTFSGYFHINYPV